VEEGGAHPNGAALVNGAAVAVFPAMRRLRWSSSMAAGSCSSKGARGVREWLPTKGRASAGGAHYGESKTAAATTSIPTAPTNGLDKRTREEGEGLGGVVHSPWRGEREA
jgi:hypothetical protein